MSVVRTIGRPGVQISLSNEADHRRQLALAVNRINQGHINSTLLVTLDPNVATTEVVDTRISVQTCVTMHPTTANAAAAIPTTYIVCSNGTMTFNHVNNAQTDRTFTVGMVG